jgi:hypothetical protein
MEDAHTNRTEAIAAGQSGHVVLETFDLGYPWPIFDPFIAAAHLVDHYPAANREMGPATSDGQRDPHADWSAPGQRRRPDPLPGAQPITAK